MLGVTVSMVYNLFSKELLFPSELEEFIFSDLKGNYNPEFEKVKQTLYDNEYDLKRYLGTYFPGSFSESYAIFSNLFCNKHIRNNFEIKRDFYILDIGGGTGGNLLGLLWFMKKYLIDFDNKRIHIVSIDGNDYALDKQRKLIERFFPKNTDLFQKSIILSQNSFKETLKNIIYDCKITNKFDIIMSFRFINEFYRESFLFSWNEIQGKDNERVIEYLKDTIGINWVNEATFENDDMIITISNDRNTLSFEIIDYETAVLIIDGKKTDDLILKKENNTKNIYIDKYYKNKGMYKIITESVSEYLEEKGMFILSDVTDIINDNHNLFLSKIMNRETVEYLNSKDSKLKVIVPLSCAFWHKFCRTKNCFTKSESYLRLKNRTDLGENRPDLIEIRCCYKIFSNKELACQVLEHIDKQDYYNIGENRTCKKGNHRYRDKNAINYRDAFSLEQI